MKAAQLYGKEDIRLESVDLPALRGRDMLLRIRSCGICGSDTRMFFNGPSARYINPVILGHEICAEVAELGPDVEGYRPGDLVGLAPIIPCMHCKTCTSGQDNICETAKVIGCNIHGAMAEYMFIPGQMVQVGGVVKAPADVSPHDVALAELVGCCIHGLRQVGLDAGEKVLVIGGGPIGMTFVQLGKMMGARVFTSEILEHRRHLALELGAEEAIDPTKTDLVKFFGNTFDRVIVATASVPATEETFNLVRTGGSLLFFSGYLKGSTLALELNNIHYRELHIHGSIDCTILDYQKAVRLLPQLQMGKLVSNSYPLDQTVEAFYATRDPQAIKILIEP